MFCTWIIINGTISCRYRRIDALYTWELLILVLEHSIRLGAGMAWLVHVFLPSLPERGEIAAHTGLYV